MKKSTLYLFSLLIFFTFVAMASITLPKVSQAATSEEINLNVYVETAIGYSKDIEVTALHDGSRKYTLQSVSTANGQYHYYLKTSSNLSSTGWKIRVKLNKTCGAWGIPNFYCSPYDKTSATATLRIPSKWNATTKGINWASVGSSKARPNPSTSTPTQPVQQGPLLSLTGVLNHVTGANIPAEDRVWYIKPGSGDNLVLGASYTTASWDSTPPTVGATYACNYYEPRSNPTQVSCKKGSSPPTQRTDPSEPGSGDATTGGSTGTTAETPKAPLEAKINGIAKTPFITDFNWGCPEGSTVYTSGILAGVSCQGPTKDLKSVTLIITNVIRYLLLPIAGAVFVFMFVLGGIQYTTAGGNETRVGQAKKTLTYAVIGLLVVLLSYTIIAVFVKIIGGGIR